MHQGISPVVKFRCQAEMLSVPEAIANNTKLSVAVVLLQGPELECGAWCKNSFLCVSNSHYLGLS